MNKLKCRECGKEFKNVAATSRHVTKEHNMKVKDYYDKYFKENGEDKCKNDLCVGGGKNSFLSLGRGYNNCCCTKCGSIWGLSRNKKG